MDTTKKVEVDTFSECIKDSDLTETMSLIHEKYAVFPTYKTRNNIVL